LNTNDLITSIVSSLSALNLNLSGNPVPISVRKLPLKQETIDPPTQVIVCPGDTPEEFRRASYNNHFFYSPQVQVVIITPNDAQEYTNLNTYLQWREQIAGALVAISGPLALSVEYDVPLDREQVADNYDYISLNARATLFQ